jgi:RNA-directed DNA polymerase
MVQQAIAQVLTPIFVPGFSASSFGYRPQRSAHGALRQVQAYVEQGYRIAVDLDLDKFFDRAGHDILMARVARKVADKRVLALIGRFLRAGRYGRRRPPAHRAGDSARRPAFPTAQ